MPGFVAIVIVNTRDTTAMENCHSAPENDAASEQHMAACGGMMQHCR